MSAFDLTQLEADELINTEKFCLDDSWFSYPVAGGKLSIPLFSADRRESFSLDIYRGRIDLKKNTFQNRARKSIPICRLDLGDGIHINPDGKEILCPHIHFYKEGYGDRFAVPLPQSFDGLNNIYDILYEFMNLCNIKKKPNIERELI